MSADIFAQYLRPPKSVMDYQAEMDDRDARRTQNQIAMLGLQQQQDISRNAMEDRNTLSRIAGGWNADTTLEQRINALRNSGRAGLMSQADALEKQGLEKQKTASTIAKEGADTESKQYETKRKMLEHGILSLQTAQTPEDAIAQLQSGVQQGYWSMQDAQRKISMVPRDPQQFNEWRMNQLRAVTEAYRQMPTVQTRNTGGTTDTVSIDPFTGRAVVTGSVQNTQSPDSVATNATTRRGQDLAEARAREAAGQAQFIPVDGVGLYVGDKRTGVARPVVDPSGKPVVPNKALTVDQAKANLFGTRMLEADKIITGLADKGVKSPSVAQQITGGQGTTGMVATAMASPEQQQVDQAERDFINAVLRRESGAAISAPEFDNARKQYFVQPGDSKEVIAQKARNRQIAIQGMLAEVPDGRRGVDLTQIQSAQGGPGPVKPNTSIVNTDADYNALPSGARFQAPDGTTRVKP